MPTVMVSCGEASGDLYAGALATELQRLAPGTRVFGLGGPRLAESGAELVGDYRGLAVTGLTEALRVLPRSFGMLRRLRARLLSDRPDVLVAVDFPDFNFGLAQSARKLEIPVVYYISPQLWAWRPGRIRTMKAIATKVLVIFPFEQQIYERAGIPVEFVGHPLIDLIHVTTDRSDLLTSHGLDPEAPTVALLPGSRPNEVRAILPTLAAAAPLIRAHLPKAQFVIARAPNLASSLFASLTTPGGITVVDERADDVLNASDVVVTASGTATVQAALHLRPMVIVYRLSPLTYRLGRRFVKLDTFGMVNLVSGRRIVPELMQDGFTPERVDEEVRSLLTDRARADTMRRDLRDMRSRLGDAGASCRAATAVLAIARSAQGRTGE
jgi:lipid-A-disaccharide synthase